MKLYILVFVALLKLTHGDVEYAAGQNQVDVSSQAGEYREDAGRRRPLSRGTRRETIDGTNLVPEWQTEPKVTNLDRKDRRIRTQEPSRPTDTSTLASMNISSSTTTTTKAIPKKPSRMRADVSAIDYLLVDPELTVLASQLHATGIADEGFFKKVAISVFAPTDAVFASLPLDMNALEFPGKMEILKKIIDYHTLAPKLLRPEQIKEGKTYIGKTRNRPQLLDIEREGPEDTDLVVNGYARVTEVVEAVKGFVYKVDSLLYPRWNTGPNLVEYIRSQPWLSKTRWLMEQSGMADQFALAGPVTSFLVPDDGWVTPNGVEIPDCFFHALARKENLPTLQGILSWLTLPGVVNSTYIQSVDTLVNAQLPHLAVAHVRNSTSQADSFTFIEGKQVKTWDVSVFNGMVHILEELPFRPDLDLMMGLWDCVHDLCFECPKLAGVILRYFDNGGTLPGDEPREKIVPPGARPTWVCQGTERWFPPGWNDNKWFDYLKAAKKQAGNAEKLARKGHTDAAFKLAKLEDDLELERITQAQQEAKQDWTSPHAAVKPGRDPSMNVMGRVNRMQRPFPDCKHKDDTLKLTVNDLRYITRWQ